MLVLIEPEEHPGDEHDHADDRSSSERRDLEHGGLNALHLMRGHPMHDRIIESLCGPSANFLSQLRKRPREKDGDRRTGHEKDPEDRVGVMRVLPDDA